MKRRILRFVVFLLVAGVMPGSVSSPAFSGSSPDGSGPEFSSALLTVAEAVAETATSGMIPAAGEDSQERVLIHIAILVVVLIGGAAFEWLASERRDETSDGGDFPGGGSVDRGREE